MRSLFVALAAVSAALAACGGGPAPAPVAPVPDPPTPAESPAGADPAPSDAARAAALEELTAEEAKSGQCDPEHKAALEKLLDEIEANVRAKEEDGRPLDIQSFTKRALALSDAAKGIQLTLTGKGTQVHVIALSSKEVSLDVLAGTQAATTMRSTYQREVTSGQAQISLPKIGHLVSLERDSRQIEMKPGTPLEVRMRGQGCAAVVVFSKS